MKLLCLNIWGGREYESLMDFLAKQKEDVDIFCFQEVFQTSSDKKESHGIRANIYFELTQLLSEFNGLFAPTVKNEDFAGPVDFPLEYGLAMFIRKSIAINESKIRLVHDGTTGGRGHSRVIQAAVIQGKKRAITVTNFHGLVLEKSDTKIDIPERLAQSKKIKEFLDAEASPKILCGDFNVRPDTESLRMFESEMKNLVDTAVITTTRSPLYERSEKYSDYILVSPEIGVKNFDVLPDTVSDHLPLLLEFT